MARLPKDIEVLGRTYVRGLDILGAATAGAGGRGNTAPMRAARPVMAPPPPAAGPPPPDTGRSTAMAQIQAQLRHAVERQGPGVNAGGAAGKTAPPPIPAALVNAAINVATTGTASGAPADGSTLTPASKTGILINALKGRTIDPNTGAVVPIPPDPGALPPGVPPPAQNPIPFDPGMASSASSGGAGAGADDGSSYDPNAGYDPNADSGYDPGYGGGGYDPNSEPFDMPEQSSAVDAFRRGVDPFDQGDGAAFAPDDQPTGDVDNYAQDADARMDAAELDDDMNAPRGGEESETVMGFDMDELKDVFTRGYEMEITDEEPDVLRRRGSVHRGSAYLQDVTYPPHGSSSGQEGGIMEPYETTEVFGAAYSAGRDFLGAVAQSRRAAPPRAGFVTRGATNAGGKRVQVTSLVINKPKSGDNAASIKNARDAGNRAVAVANKAIAALKKAPAKPATAVHGAVPLRGRAAPAARRGPVASTAKAVHLTPAQALAYANKALKAGKAALDGADKHSKTVQANQARITSGSRLVRSATSVVGPQTNIHGDLTIGDDVEVLGQMEDDVTILGAFYETFVEDLIGYDGPYDDVFFGGSDEDIVIHGGGDIDIFGNDISIFGFTGPMPDDGTGAIDPNTGLPPIDPATYGTTDPNTGLPIDPNAAGAAAGGPAIVPGQEVAALGPAPTTAPALTPGMDYAPAPGPALTDSIVYSSTGGGTPLPIGAIIYDGSKGTPRRAMASQSWWTTGQNLGTDGQGFVWGWDEMGWPGGSPNPMRWIECTGMGGDPFKHMIWFDLTPDQVGKVGFLSAQAPRNYGPIIGNPNDTNFKDARYDAGANVWFWYRDQAPKWACAPDDATRLNQAILDYKAAFAAASADDAAAAAQAALDAQTAAALAKQQAADDADQLHQQQQEEQETTHQATMQAALDAQQADTQSQQQQIADESYARRLAAQAQYAPQAQYADDGGGYDQGYADDGGGQDDGGVDNGGVNWDAMPDEGGGMDDEPYYEETQDGMPF